jgi:hypothetical protein
MNLEKMREIIIALEEYLKNRFVPVIRLLNLKIINDRKGIFCFKCGWEIYPDELIYRNEISRWKYDTEYQAIYCFDCYQQILEEIENKWFTKEESHVSTSDEK